jgi:bifunctional DNA-binding transcriptional regulator/antitoxin component of YhaV-PrlF toxin-antitoxin module
MADFALFVTAAEEALGWEPGYFLEIYDRNRAEANSIVLDASPVAQKLRTFLDQLTDDTYQRIYQLEGKWETEEGNSDVSTWTGPAASLLRNLNKLLNDEERRQKSWPKDARSLSVALRRLVANLKADGLIVHFCRESKARDIQISRASSVSHAT